MDADRSMETRLVSVVVPVRDRAELTMKAVKSVLNQSFQAFELIVVDDGSTDDLSEVQSLVEAAGHQFVSTPPMGVSHARNLGVALTTAPFLSFLDTDDWWHEDKLKEQMDYLGKNPDCQLVQCEEVWIRNGKRVNQKKIHQMPEGAFFEKALQLCCISPSAVVLCRKLFNSFAGFDERMRVCEDYDLWLRISVKHEVALIKKPLVFKLGGHDDQLSKAEPAMDRFRLFSLIKLLSSDGLSEKQESLVFLHALRRLSILKQGARKRELPTLKKYVKLEEELVEHTTNEAPDRATSLYSQLHPLLDQVLCHPDGTENQVN